MEASNGYSISRRCQKETLCLRTNTAQSAPPLEHPPRYLRQALADFPRLDPLLLLAYLMLSHLEDLPVQRKLPVSGCSRGGRGGRWGSRIRVALV